MLIEKLKSGSLWMHFSKTVAELKIGRSKKKCRKEIVIKNGECGKSVCFQIGGGDETKSMVEANMYSIFFFLLEGE